MGHGAWGMGHGRKKGYFQYLNFFSTKDFPA
jgi:hypothetical protein